MTLFIKSNITQRWTNLFEDIYKPWYIRRCGECGIKIDAHTEIGTFFGQIIQNDLTHTLEVRGAVSIDILHNTAIVTCTDISILDCALWRWYHGKEIRLQYLSTNFDTNFSTSSQVITVCNFLQINLLLFHMLKCDFLKLCKVYFEPLYIILLWQI